MNKKIFLIIITAIVLISGGLYWFFLSPFVGRYVDCHTNWLPGTIYSGLVQYHDGDYLVVEGNWEIGQTVCGMEGCIDAEKRYDTLGTRTEFCTPVNPTYKDLVRETESRREIEYLSSLK